MDDDWITANSQIDPAKLHAIGVIVYRWNGCEFMLRALLIYVLGNKFEEGWTETHGMGARDISKTLRDGINATQHPAGIKECVLYALELHDLNRLNRNQFAHFIISRSKGGGLELRNSKNPSLTEIFRQKALDTGLDTIRRVADEIERCSTFHSSVFNWFSLKRYSYSISEAPVLPKKPPLPQSIWRPLPTRNIQEP